MNDAGYVTLEKDEGVIGVGLRQAECCLRHGATPKVTVWLDSGNSIFGEYVEANERVMVLKDSTLIFIHLGAISAIAVTAVGKSPNG